MFHCRNNFGFRFPTITYAIRKLSHKSFQMELVTFIWENISWFLSLPNVLLEIEPWLNFEKL